MKKIAVLTVLISFFLMISSQLAQAALFEREMPQEVAADELFVVDIVFSGAYSGVKSKFTEKYAPGFVLQSWEMTGIAEMPDNIKVTTDQGTYTFEFTPTQQDVTLKYWIRSPASGGVHTIIGRIDDEDNGISDNFILKVESDICGNGLCESEENVSTCPQDCATVDNGDDTTSPVQNETNSGTVDEYYDIPDSPSRDVQAEITPIATSGNDAQDIFSRKKDSGNNTLLIVTIIGVVLGLTAFGLYYQKSRKSSTIFINKDAAKETKEEVKDTLERLKGSSKSSGMNKDEFIEKASSELPAFSEGTTRLEIPDLPSELRIKPKFQMSIPPMPVQKKLPKQMPLNVATSPISDKDSDAEIPDQDETIEEEFDKLMKKPKKG